MTKFEVVVGASGRWVARQVTVQFANGKVRTGTPIVAGKARRGMNGASLIPEIQRKLRAGELIDPARDPGPFGGSSWIVELETDM
jgi:hypothetical protein